MKRIFIVLLLALAFTSCLKKEDYHIDISYTGEELRYVNCPLGGIGTGNLLINGYGSIREFEIFNRASMDEISPYMTFFSLFTQEEGEELVVRIMEREFLDEYPNPFGKPRQQLGGLPRFKEAIFHNAYPIINIDLIDEDVPLDVRMHAWSPFIPIDPVNSELPTAVIEWTLTNNSKSLTSYSLAFTMGNPLIRTTENGDLSSNSCITESAIRPNWKSFLFSNTNEEENIPNTGDFMVSFPENSELIVPLASGEWIDDAQLFWNDFSEDDERELLIIHLADYLANKIGFSSFDTEENNDKSDLDIQASLEKMKFLKQLNLDTGRVMEIADEIKKSIQDSAQAF